MAAFCAGHGYSGRTRPELLVERLRTNLLSASHGTIGGKAFTALMFTDQLELLNNQIRLISKHIRDLLITHPMRASSSASPAWLTSPPRSCSPRWAKTGPGSRPPTSCGPRPAPRPVTRSSGRSHAVRFRYAANKCMRNAIDWWALVSVRENPWAHEAYDQARARVQQHNRVLRGIGVRLTLILWRCWTDHTTYDSIVQLKQPAPRTA